MRLDKLSVEFLTRVLAPDQRGQVTAVSATSMSRGRMADSVRLRLSWRPRGSGPATVVVKVGSSSPATRRTAAMTRAYEVEAGFYNDLAPILSVNTPTCYFAGHQADPDDYLLVLEDLAELALVAGDQIAGCSVDEAAGALEELARLHAEAMAVRSGALPWLRTSSMHGADARLGRLVSTLGPRFLERYGGRMDSAVVNLIDQFVPRAARYGVDATGPITVLHGDFRSDNLLFGGGRVAVVDWQTVSRGPAIADVSYFLGGSLQPDDRRRAEHTLLRHYHDHVCRSGFPLTWPMCWSDYRRFSYAGLVMAITAGTMVARTDRDEELFAALATRSGLLALDLDARV
jgi:hypothetical protein